tara:strand:- start:522 stop:752 length:231 start_codon:yes stop_codon:yes gene_type:complete
MAKLNAIKGATYRADKPKKNWSYKRSKRIKLQRLQREISAKPARKKSTFKSVNDWISQMGEDVRVQTYVESKVRYV